jgi:hypothetical protein
MEEESLTASLGEPLESVLDLTSWRDGKDQSALYEQLRTVVAESVAQSERTRQPIRDIVVKRLRASAGTGTSPKEAGLYSLTPGDIAEVHRHLLFNGAAEACDGTVIAHDSLLLTVAQIGVALVAYQGGTGSWVQRLYRRDLRETYEDPVEEAIALLERRSRSDSADADDTRDPVSRLLRRGLMEYAERAILLHRSTAPWRIGHGHPVTTTILLPTTRSLFLASIDVLRGLLLDHKKFLYVASSPADRLARTIGDSLYPLEYAVIGTIGDSFNDHHIDSLTSKSTGHPQERIALRQFLTDVRSEIVYGVYRVTDYSPAQVFYAHKDYVHAAASLAMADSVLQPHRGFPMLIDLADLVCRSTFDGGSFAGLVHSAYAAAGAPVRYLGERETRSR